MRRIIASYVVYLREDLKIAQSCRMAHDKCLKTIHESGWFASEFRAFLKKDNPDRPYIIHENDPKQVVLIKKILNSLEHAEAALKKLERLDVRADRYSVSIGFDVARACYQSINEIYTTLQLLNHSGSEIQTLLEPHLAALMPKLSLAWKGLDALSKQENLEEKFGQRMGIGISMLPDNPLTTEQSYQHTSLLIFNLPEYIAQCSSVIGLAPDLESPTALSPSSPEFRALMKKRAEKTAHYLQAFAERTGGFSNYYSLTKKLLTQSSYLINEGAPTSKKAYQEAEKMLATIKHETLPQLLAELENAEERFCLRPSTLTKSALKNMETFYNALVIKVNLIAAGANAFDGAKERIEHTPGIGLFKDKTILPTYTDVKLEPDKNLHIMQDETFQQQRKEMQLARYNIAWCKANDTLALDAAKAFFNRLNAYNTLHKAGCRWNLGNVSMNEKVLLIQDYKKFQDYFAANYKDIDALIVSALTQSESSSLLATMGNTVKSLWSSDHFKQVLACQEQVISSIKQDMAFHQLQANLILKTMTDSAGSTIDHDSIKDQLKDLLGTTEAREQALNDEPLIVLGSEHEHDHLFDLLSSYKLSEQFATLLKDKMPAYLKSNLSEHVWKALATEDGSHLDMTKIPYLEFHKDPPEVALYKQAINTLYYIKEGLEKLEQLPELGNPSSTINRSRYVYAIIDALFLKIGYGVYYLRAGIDNPALKAVMQDALNLLKPLQTAPMISGYFSKNEMKTEVDSKSLEAPDFVAIWEKQQALMQQAPNASEPTVIPTSTPTKEPAKPAKKADVEQPSTLNVIIKHFCRLPVKLQDLKEPTAENEEHHKALEEEINTIVRNLESLQSVTTPEAKLGVKKVALQKALQSLTLLEVRASQSGALTKELITTHLKEIRAELNTILLTTADDIEFHLGLKPGTYAQTISDELETFYKNLVGQMPLGKEQQGLEILMDSTSLQRRILHEESRLNTIRDGQHAQELRNVIFGGPEFDAFNTSFNAFYTLKQLLNEFVIQDRLGNTERTLLDIRQDIENTYQLVQSELAKINPKYTTNFLRNLEFDDIESIAQEIVDMNKVMLKPKGDLAKILSMALNQDVDNPVWRKQFIQHYQALQPYLRQIHYTYDNYYFLRELQTSADFSNAADKMVQNTKALSELVDAARNTQEEHALLAQQRIVYFKALLEQQEKTIEPGFLEAFKAKKFNAFYDKLLQQALVEQLGPLYEPFVAYLAPHARNLEKDILDGVSIKDDIEEKIKERLLAALPEYIKKYTQSFKEQLFKDVVENTVKTRLQKKLTVYATPFFESFAHQFDNLKQSLLPTIPLDKNFQIKINAQINLLAKTIETQTMGLKKALVDLSLLAHQAQTYLDEELKRPAANRLTEDKLNILTKLKKELASLELPKENAEDAVLAISATAKEGLSQYELYNQLEKNYYILASIRAQISNESDTEHQEELLIRVNLLMGNLTDPHLNPATRNEQVLLQIRELNQALSAKSTTKALSKALEVQFLTASIEHEIKTQLCDALGPYFSAVNTHMMEAVIKDKKALTEQIAIGNQDVYAAKATEMIQQQHEYIEMLRELNKQLKQVEFEVSNESDQDNTNPCRVEKIHALEEIKKILLLNANASTPEQRAALRAHKKKASDDLKLIALHNKMIVIYDKLKELNTVVQCDTDISERVKLEKQAAIKTMQEFLTTPQDGVSLKDRVAKIAQYAQSSQYDSIMNKNSNNRLKNLWISFKLWISSLGSGPSLRQKVHAEFKDELLRTKDIDDVGNKPSRLG